MAADRRITSRQNALVRRFRELATERSGPQVLLEGERLIGDALDSRVPIETLISGGGHDDLVNRARRAGAEIYEGTAAVLDAVSPVRTASGIVAIATWTPRSLEEIFADSRSKDRLLHPTILGLVDVQDPGNVGAVIRSADAFGGVPVLALGRTADPGSWKALRGAMGSTFRVPVARGEVKPALDAARVHQVQVAATVPAGGTPITEIDWRQPILVLLGSEGSGLPEALTRSADLRVTIPMRRAINSLNVAASAAIVLYEAQRHRREARA